MKKSDCLERRLLPEPYTTKDRAQQVAKSYRARRLGISASVYERRIKAGGLWMDVWVVLVTRPRPDGHQWDGRRNPTASPGVESEHCSLCGITRYVQVQAEEVLA